MLVAKLTLLVCSIGFLSADYTKDPYVSVELVTTWQTLCNSLQDFRTNIATITKISVNLIVVQNANQYCLKNGGGTQSTGSIKVHLSVLKESGNAETDVASTLKVRDGLKNVRYIGSYRILFVEARSIPIETMKFSNETILIVIGIVLTIYLIGYFLILGVKSFSSIDGKDRPLSFIINAENQYFVNGARRHKSRQYNISRITSSKSVEDIAKQSYSSRE